MVRFLVVDGDDTGSEILAEYLESKGHSTKTVTDVEGALGVLRADYFDVILIDHKLPGYCGLEFLKDIRRRCMVADRFVPIIIVTAEDGVTAAKIREEVNTLQPASVLCKPFRPTDLLDEVHRVCQPRRRPS